MTKPVNPKVKGRVIMKVSITASGWTLPNGRLTARTMTTMASRHSQAIAAYFDTRFVFEQVMTPTSSPADGGLSNSSFKNI